MRIIYFIIAIITLNKSKLQLNGIPSKWITACSGIKNNIFNINYMYIIGSSKCAFTIIVMTFLASYNLIITKQVYSSDEGQTRAA